MLLILHTVITISYVYIKINKNKKIIFNLLIPGTLAAQGPRQDPTLDRLPFHCRHTHTHIHTPLRLGQFSTLYQYFNFFFLLSNRVNIMHIFGIWRETGILGKKPHADMGRICNSIQTVGPARN